MSWLHKVMPILKSHYLLVDPEEYYEWEHNGQIPEKTPINYGNVRSVSSLNKLVMAVDGEIQGQELSSPLPFNSLTFVSGSAKTKDEILLTYEKMNGRFSEGLNRFKESMKSRGYFATSDKKPALCNIKSSTDDEVAISNFGPWEEIVKKARELQAGLNSMPRQPGYKARDLTDLHSLTHALLATDYSRPVDKHKVGIVVQSSGQPSISDYTIGWKELYETLDFTASQLSERLSAYNKLQWIKSRN